MNKGEQKLVQYLVEARASEHALVRVLQSQIAMTPRGSYRSALEKHLDETRRHAARVGGRLKTLDGGFNPRTAVVSFWEEVFGQTLALSKTPLDLLRGSGGEEKVLKNAKDTCATESLEVATYAVIERVARQVGDEETAELASRIRAEEERMLARVMRELPRLADAVIGAEVEGESGYDVTETGAGETVREVGGTVRGAARKTGQAARRTARQARRAPGVARVQGTVKGAVATEQRPADLRVRRAHRRADRQPAGRPVADRPGQDRRLRAQGPEPHDDPQPGGEPARRRAVAGIR